MCPRSGKHAACECVSQRLVVKPILSRKGPQMVAIKRILLPTDFSELADHAALFARMLSETHGAALHVLHVRNPLAAAVPAPEAAAGIMLLPASEAELRQQLELFVRERLSGIRAPVVAEVLTGSPVSEITRYAKEAHIDLIVVGTHARGVVNRIFFGSVSKSVLENAPCPVLMVPLASAVDEETGTTTRDLGDLPPRGCQDPPS
ncbi:MAG: universal stress protein [Planctomycetes bacterium]|nr:universal stress protein [Planctomycetota bacterium]